MDTISRVRAEIERRRKENEIQEGKDYAQYELDVASGYDMALDDLLSFLDTLEEKSEIPTNIDEAAEKASIEKYPNEIDLNGDHDAEIWYKQHVKYWRMGFKKGFKAGAEWAFKQK